MRISELFNIDLPIIQSPMAGVQDSELTIAVSEAGGLGSLACATYDVQVLTEQLERITCRTKKAYNVNFFCHTLPAENVNHIEAWWQRLKPYYDQRGLPSPMLSTNVGLKPFSAEILDAIKAFKPPVFSFHFGLPEQDFVEEIQSWGSRIVSSATTVKEALWLQQKGVDAIIAQGTEAGGHRGMFLENTLKGQCGTVDLLRKIKQVVDVPIIAAGGIVDKLGIDKMLGLGAIAVQMGTVFLLCDEVKCNARHRAALQNPQRVDTEITNVFTGRLARSLTNRLVRELGPICEDMPQFPLASNLLGPIRSVAEKAEQDDFTPLWAGVNNRACKAVSAEQLVREWFNTGPET